MVTHSTDASTLSSPYRDTEVNVYGGHLSILINDPSVKDKDIEKMKLVDAILVTDTGREIDLGRPFYTGYGIGVTYAFDLGKVGFSGDDFGLRVTTRMGGKTTTITGKFSVHGHFQMNNMEQSLDPH
jgi:hypothetical protein